MCLTGAHFSFLSLVVHLLPGTDRFFAVKKTVDGQAKVHGGGAYKKVIHRLHMDFGASAGEDACFEKCVETCGRNPLQAGKLTDYNTSYQQKRRTQNDSIKRCNCRR